MENNKTISISKNFTIEEVAKFRTNMNRLIENGEKDFILDFHQCDFIDSTGLGVIVAVYKKCVEKNGSIKLTGLNEQVAKLFKLTRLDRVFEIGSY